MTTHAPRGESLGAAALATGRDSQLSSSADRRPPIGPKSESGPRCRGDTRFATIGLDGTILGAGERGPWMRIETRVAVVTGASSGLGAGLARRLAAEGVRVGLTARRQAPLDELAREIRAAGGVAEVVVADAADLEAAGAAVRTLADRLGPVDLLVANAGLGLSTPAVGFSADAVARIFRVNVLGAAAAIEAVLPGMIERRRGHLVGISSLAGARGLPGTCGYSASKAALSSLLEGLRIDLRGRGVAVTTVHPGYIRTPMTAGSARPQPFLMELEPAVERILRGIADRKRVVNFPWPSAALVALGRLLPSALYDPLIVRIMGGTSAPVEGAGPTE